MSDAASDRLIDPGKIVRKEFDAWVGETFQVPVTDSDCLPLQLEKVESSTFNDRSRRNGDGPFSLVLTGPKERYFHQATVNLTLPDGRVCPLFIVNNGPMNDRMCYQVVFN